MKFKYFYNPIKKQPFVISEAFATWLINEGHSEDVIVKTLSDDFKYIIVMRTKFSLCVLMDASSLALIEFDTKEKAEDFIISHGSDTVRYEVLPVAI